MEKKNFDFKLVDYDNLNEMAEMFNLCFSSMPPKNYFDWKFLQNPAAENKSIWKERISILNW